MYRTGCIDAFAYCATDRMTSRSCCTLSTTYMVFLHVNQAQISALRITRSVCWNLLTVVAELELESVERERRALITPGGTSCCGLDIESLGHCWWTDVPLSDHWRASRCHITSKTKTRDGFFRLNVNQTFCWLYWQQVYPKDNLLL